MDEIYNELNEKFDKFVNEAVTPLIDKWYEIIKSKEANDFPPGTIYYSLIYFPTIEPLLLEPAKLPLTDKFKIKKIKKISDLNNLHIPIKDVQGISLRKDENLFILKGKLRPVILLPKYLTRLENFMYGEETYLCAPIFSIDFSKYKTLDEQKYIYEVTTFKHPSAFFLPKSEDGLREHSIVRLERIQPIPKKLLDKFFPFESGNLDNIRLTSEVFNLLIIQFFRFLYSEKLIFDFKEKANDQKSNLEEILDTLNTMSQVLKEEIEKIFSIENN